MGQKNPTKKETNQWNDDYVASLLDKVKYILGRKKTKNKKARRKVAFQRHLTGSDLESGILVISLW